MAKYMIDKSNGEWMPFDEEVFIKAKDKFTKVDEVPKYLRKRNDGRYYPFSPQMGSRSDMEPVYETPEEMVKVSEKAKKKQEEEKEAENQRKKDEIAAQGAALGIAIKDAMNDNSLKPGGNEQSQTNPEPPTPPAPEGAGEGNGNPPEGTNMFADLTDEVLEEMAFKDLKSRLAGNYTGTPNHETLKEIARTLRNSVSG